jgi:hypothetical protein
VRPQPADAVRCLAFLAQAGVRRNVQRERQISKYAVPQIVKLVEVLEKPSVGKR